MPVIDPDPLTDGLRALWRGFRDKPTDSNSPRDSFGMKWAKFISIILVAGLVMGCLFAFSTYVAAFVGLFDSRSHTRLTDFHDTGSAFEHRFILGGCVGGSLGLIYMVWCLIKRRDQ